jgi:hypothetical protein
MHGFNQMHKAEYLLQMPYFLVLLPSTGGTDWVCVRYGPRPLMRAKYRAYEPCLMSTPWPAAEQDPGRMRVTDVFVEFAPWLGTFRTTRPGSARSLPWFQFTNPYLAKGFTYTFNPAKFSKYSDCDTRTVFWMRHWVASADDVPPTLHPLHRLEYTYHCGWLPERSKHWLQ